MSGLLCRPALGMKMVWVGSCPATPQESEAYLATQMLLARGVISRAAFSTLFCICSGYPILLCLVALFGRKRAQLDGAHPPIVSLTIAAYKRALTVHSVCGIH